MTRDAQAITLSAFAQAHEPLPELPALPPAPVALALPSMATAPVFPSPVVQWGSVPEALDDAAPVLALCLSVLALCPSVLPMAFSQVLDPDHTIHHWLTAALPLLLAPVPDETLAIPVSPAVAPVVTEAAPVPTKARKSKNTEKTAQDKTLASDHTKQRQRRLNSGLTNSSSLDTKGIRFVSSGCLLCQFIC